MSFIGLESWRDNFPKVDFQTPAGLVDLHNNATLEKVCFHIIDATLVLAFRHSQDWREIESSGRPVELEFGGVTNLRIAQAGNYDARSANTLEGVIRESQSEDSRFIVDAGDIRFEFNVQSVELRIH